ncbi:MAG: hypothetical protein U5Q44_01670 [Dehalococcoidia bacterium]|nr:hypothetical protein [Dehalococcoidia bacterium]
MVGPLDERQVGVLRRFEAEGLGELDVLRDAGEPLFAAEHVADLHQMVVVRRGQVIGGEAVRLERNEVVLETVLEGDLAADGIVERGVALLGFISKRTTKSSERARWSDSSRVMSRQRPS